LAIIHGDYAANVVSLSADHVEMIKFEGRDDPNYTIVAAYLHDLQKVAVTKVEANWIKEGHHRSR
jgi:hypothetical protein